MKIKNNLSEMLQINLDTSHHLHKIIEVELHLHSIAYIEPDAMKDASVIIMDMIKRFCADIYAPQIVALNQLEMVIRAHFFHSLQFAKDGLSIDPTIEKAIEVLRNSMTAIDARFATPESISETMGLP